MTTATSYRAGQRLEARLTGFRISVESVSQDGNIVVLAGGKRVNTSASYLFAQYRTIDPA